MHLDVSLTLPKTLLLVHVGRHLPPLLGLLVLLLVRLHCIYTRRTHPPPSREREREQQSMQVGLVWRESSVTDFEPTNIFEIVSCFLLLP